MIDDTKANEEMKQASIVGAIIGGVLLAGLVFVVIWQADVVSSLPMMFFPLLLAFMVGAAIGGSIEVWINEASNKNQQYRSK